MEGESADTTAGNALIHALIAAGGQDPEWLTQAQLTDAHVRMVHPDNNGGVRMLRRGYNFVDGSTGLGRLDAGLFFIAYVCDPRTHYIPVQMKIARGDGMSEYLRHTGSGLFAVPPGVAPGGFLGQALFSG